MVESDAERGTAGPITQSTTPAARTAASPQSSRYSGSEKAFEGVYMQSRRSRWGDHLRTLFLALNTVLLAAVLILLVKNNQHSGQMCSIPTSSDAMNDSTVLAPQPPLKLLGDINGLVPDFPLQKVVFQNTTRYADRDMWKNETVFKKILNNWNADYPVGQGFVNIEDWKNYELGPPMQYKNTPGAGYSIAIYHQYHCLYRIMYMYGGYRYGHPDHDPDMERHVAHCFDYLRQSLDCAGDSALEGVSSTVADMADGWGVTHVCRNKDKLFKWVVDNRYTNDTGVD